MKSVIIFSSIVLSCIVYTATASASDVCPTLAEIHKNAELFDTVYHAQQGRAPDFLGDGTEGEAYASKTFTSLNKNWNLISLNFNGTSDDEKLQLAQSDAKNVIEESFFYNTGNAAGEHTIACLYSTLASKQSDEFPTIVAIFEKGKNPIQNSQMKFLQSFNKPVKAN